MRLIATLLSLTLLLTGCGADDHGEESFTISGSTDFVSTSLESDTSNSVQKSIITLSDSNIYITPTNVTGEAMAMLYGFGTGQGLDVFGPERPDLAGPDTELVEFDLSEQLVISSDISVKDDFPGGTSEILVLSFGYMDIYFTIDNTQLTQSDNIVRVAMGSVENMTRGDVMMYIDGEFKWYDLDNTEFTTLRPDNPVVIEDIRDFYDESTPDRHFYAFNTDLLNGGVTVDVDELRSSTGVSNTVDFYLEQLITIDNTATANLTDAILIQNFSLESILDNEGDGLSASASIQILN